VASIVDRNQQVWEAHTTAEFVAADVDATMATMTDDPLVVHVATSVGARGREAVRRFYADHGETRRGVEQLYSEIEVTADDIAEVIAFVVGRRGALPSTRSSCDRPVRNSDGKQQCPASAAVERPRERRGTAGNGGERLRPLRLPRTARTTKCPVSPAHRAPCDRGSEKASTRLGEVTSGTTRARGPRGSAAADARAVWLPIRLPTTASASTVAGRT
jgi:hypothetical protein